MVDLGFSLIVAAVDTVSKIRTKRDMNLQSVSHVNLWLDDIRRDLNVIGTKKKVSSRWLAEKWSVALGRKPLFTSKILPSTVDDLSRVWQYPFYVNDKPTVNLVKYDNTLDYFDEGYIIRLDSLASGLRDGLLQNKVRLEEQKMKLNQDILSLNSILKVAEMELQQLQTDFETFVNILNETLMSISNSEDIDKIHALISDLFTSQEMITLLYKPKSIVFGAYYITRYHPDRRVQNEYDSSLLITKLLSVQKLIDNKIQADYGSKEQFAIQYHTTIGPDRDDLDNVSFLEWLINLIKSKIQNISDSFNGGY